MKKARKLLVEGGDDKHVISALLKHRNFPETFEIEEKHGIDNVMHTFPVQAKGSGIEAVGIVIDADINLQSRWSSLKSALDLLGYLPPTEFSSGGLVLEAEFLPRVGAWIMPNNNTSGMLEDFVGHLVPPHDELWAHAGAVLANLPAGLARFNAAHNSKARIHTWLAWQSDPGTPMGLAITKKYFDAGAPTSEPFLQWLHRLFVE